ncbi:hypothetical protein ACQP2F_18945 [Actinoplanes sp. CA-030573]|uniref:hypothetical protein n=1 Tax=Actinoplanes sp. CA-030573 TaxID=3239898 RepID=UPI003D943385
MTSPDLYALLPAVHRLRDDRGELAALLGIVAEQAGLLRADIEVLYANWFIETCADWVVPYLGDLVGYRMPPLPAEALSGPAGRRLLRALAPRREVADTVANRRRKGTLAQLEEMAADVTGWYARAVEARPQLIHCQPLRLFPGDPAGALPDLRDGGALDRIGGGFDAITRLPDVRAAGHRDVPHAGVFVWPLKPYAVDRAPAYCLDGSRHLFTFNALGSDTALVTRPVREVAATHIAEEENVPGFITRRALADRAAEYYGPGRSLCVWRSDKDGVLTPVGLGEIVAADLHGWAYRPRRGQVAVDPELGRIAFPARQAPRYGAVVTYHYAFSDDVGGGSYHRDLPAAGYRYGVGGEEQLQTISDAVGRWRTDKEAHPERRHAVIEIVDNRVYTEQKLELPLDPGDDLTLRAADRKRPILRLLDWHSSRVDALRIIGPALEDGTEGARFTLDGLLVAGRGVLVTGRIRHAGLRHCTLVPGWDIDRHCEPVQGGEPSLLLENTTARLTVERSILGPILVDVNEIDDDPLPVRLRDSVVDGTRPDVLAVSAPDGRAAHVRLDVRRCTVLGRVRARSAELLENSIVTGKVLISRRGEGCVRFCWIPPGSRTPRRYHCQPDLALATVPPSAGRRARLVVSRLTPRFDAVRYGTPGYCRLAPSGAEQVVRGADDQSEMGVFHDLFTPWRLAGLRARLDEYLPAGSLPVLEIIT